MQSFIKYHNISSCSFSTGIVFWYWQYYKMIDEEKHKQQQSHINQNDFGGHAMKQLFVEKHYKNIKEEVLNSGLINVADYDKLVIGKAHKYIDTEKVKKMKCVFALGEKDPLHFNIQENEPLLVSHLHAVILYCDFSEFSTQFSKSFRAMKWNEPLESIKYRNSKFYHIAKHLRELVQYFGLKGYDIRDGPTESGPFYTGMSVPMTIPAFAIRLNGPTSTSKQIEIAMRFCGGYGIIIQLNNQKGTSVAESFFDASWISNYLEEDERIFCGGRFVIEIESIRTLDKKTKQWNNYENFIKIIYSFDAMLSGDFSVKNRVQDKDADMLRSLIDHFLGRKHNKLDKYTND
eukprot:542704_1